MLYSLMIAMLLTGTWDVILFKTQSQQEYYNTDKKKTMNFEHPFVQSAIAFLGEMLCLIYYYSYMYLKNRKNQNESEELMEAQKKGLKTNINVALLAIPALFDIFGSSLMFIALTLVAASIYQMLRGFVMIMTTIQSIIILRRRYHRHHYLSLFFIVCGVGIVGVSPIIFPEGTNTETSKNPILGVIIILCAQFFTAGLMISEEKILKNYYLHPLKVVGWEGFWGFSIYIFILIILYFIPWNNEDIWPYGKVEDVSVKSSHYNLYIIENILLRFYKFFWYLESTNLQSIFYYCIYKMIIDLIYKL